MKAYKTTLTIKTSSKEIQIHKDLLIVGDDYNDAVIKLKTRILDILHNITGYNNIDDLVHDAIGCMKELEYNKIYNIDTRVSRSIQINKF